MDILSLMTFLLLVAFLAFFKGAPTVAIAAGIAFFVVPALWAVRWLLFPPTRGD